MDPRRQYDDLKATEIYCPRCRNAMPVREHLLLVLPDGDLYEITCARCGTQLAKQIRKEAADSAAIPVNPSQLRRRR